MCVCVLHEYVLCVCLFCVSVFCVSIYVCLCCIMSVLCVYGVCMLHERVLVCFM